jgi:GT2 family glycosyltransferase
MVDKNTNFFKITDNFSKTAHIESILIFEAKLDFTPKITIAIPTYKRAKLLKEAVDSAINQVNYTDYDIIVVDNNPERNDETEKLMLTYVHFPNVSYYKNAENIQMAGNWNRLFTLARGKYVVMLHDDDLLFPNFLKEISAIIAKKSVDLLKPLAYWSDNMRDKNNFDTINNKHTYKLKRIYDISNYYGNALGAPTGCLIKKECVLKLGGFNQEFYPSFDFCFEVLFAKHYKCYRLLRTLFMYRILDNTSSNTEILNEFIKNDFFLHSQLLRKYHISNYFIKKFLCYKFLNVIKINRQLWKIPEYNFDLEKIGLNSKDKTIGFLIAQVLKLYIIFCKLYLYIFNRQ